MHVAADGGRSHKEQTLPLRPTLALVPYTLAGTFVERGSVICRDKELHHKNIHYSSNNCHHTISVIKTEENRGNGICTNRYFLYRTGRWLRGTGYTSKGYIYIPKTRLKIKFSNIPS